MMASSLNIFDHPMQICPFEDSVFKCLDGWFFTHLIWKKWPPIKLKLIFFHFQFLCFDDGGPWVFVICCQKEKYS